MSYKKVLTEGSTRTPEQQRAAEAGSKHAGQRPKPPKPDQMGVPPDETRSAPARKPKERTTR